MCKFGRDRAIFIVVKAICAKKFIDRQTGGRTEEQTDKRRTPRDCISIRNEWNELKIK